MTPVTAGRFGSTRARPVSADNSGLPAGISRTPGRKLLALESSTTKMLPSGSWATEIGRAVIPLISSVAIPPCMGFAHAPFTLPGFRQILVVGLLGVNVLRPVQLFVAALYGNITMPLFQLAPR